MAQRAIGYIRVSTIGQAEEGVSLEAQAARIRAWCETNDYDLRELHKDAGLSAKRTKNRKGLNAALEAVCRCRGALVVYSLSRVARSIKHAIEIAERLHKAGADLVSLTESLDTTTAAGRMMFHMLALLAEFERDLISERTIAALAHKKRKGERVGTIPYGWRVAADEIALLPVEAEQAVIREILAMRSEGRSYRSIAGELTSRRVPTKEGGPAWTHQSVASILRRAAA